MTVVVAAISMAHSVAVAVALFVSAEAFLEVAVGVPVRLFSAMRSRAVVSAVDVIAVVYTSVEILRAMKPWASSDKDATGKPFGSVVAIGCALIWRNCVIPVRANGRRSDLDSDLST